MIRDMGGVTADLDLAAACRAIARCMDGSSAKWSPSRRGRFSRSSGRLASPGELMIDGDEIFSFATVWNDLTPAEKRRKDSTRSIGGTGKSASPLAAIGANVRD